jgi:NADH dehydrogenase (ubiquinone) Fe-S protein 6
MVTRALMTIQPPETTLVETHRVSCDGSGGIRGGERFTPASLGHPRVFLEIDEQGYVDCGYCDRRFILKDSPADIASGATA